MKKLHKKYYINKKLNNMDKILYRKKIIQRRNYIEKRLFYT